MRAVSLIALTLAGCGPVVDEACTQIGCTNGVDVSFVRDAWEPGVYEVELDLHGELITCQATIPLGSDGSDGCTDDRVWLYESGSALDTSEQSIDGLFFDSTQETAIAITVYVERSEIGYAAFEPDFQTLQPNGPECEPTCLYATREIELD